MAMKNPCHPGELILHDWIGGLDLTVEATAEHMQVPAQSLDDICQGNAPVPPRRWPCASPKPSAVRPASGSSSRPTTTLLRPMEMLDQIDIKRIEPAA